MRVSKPSNVSTLVYSFAQQGLRNPALLHAASKHMRESLSQ